MSLSLNGDWKLYYALETKETRTDPEWLRANGEEITAQVPGNVELDLFRAGKEPDPFFGQNIYRFRKYEFYCWQFEKEFTVCEDEDAADWEFVFEGLNCFADVYLNDVLIGTASNAFIEHRFSAKSLLKWNESNLLTVRIRSAVNVARGLRQPTIAGPWEFGEYAMLRMPASSFGWDIMGRFLSAGMWRNVSLVPVKATRIVQTYYATKRLNNDGSADLILRYEWTTDDPMLEGFSLCLTGDCGSHHFEARKNVGFVNGGIRFRVENAQLWWPKGYGNPNLYKVQLTLEKDGVILDSKRETIGIRMLEIKHKLEAGDQGEFKIMANGFPILCKGSNWVPLDALHSRDAERLQAAHDLFEDAGCNIIRCWGGNVYEDHAFFDLCDQRGMMVWQDFGMACAIYSQEENFCKIIAEEAVSVIQKLRNHPSILLWAGDNEVDECLVEQGFPTEENRYNKLTREVLPQAVRMYDPYRVFLPSSPYIPFGIKRYEVPEQHNWGARAYFKDDFYKHSNAHFISECGYHGCPAVTSLQKYIPQEKLIPWLNNADWDTHNTDYLTYAHREYNRIELMQKQVEILFGVVPTDLETFAKLSQISQAEAKKFFIERTRIKKWRRTGVIWWNMLDGWPQISDAVVDYYYAKKLAYYYIRRVQKPIVLMMDELVDWGHNVILGNDSCQSHNVHYQVQDGDSLEVLLSGEVFSPANENVCVGNISELAGKQKLYLLTWEIDGVRYSNHYISGFPSYNPEKMLTWVNQIAALPEEFHWTV